MYVTLAGTKDKITMIEAGASEVSEDVMLEAIRKGHAEIKKIVEFIEGIVKEVGKPKYEYQSSDVPEDLFNDVREYAYAKMREAVLTEDKQVRDKNITELTEDIKQHFEEAYPEMGAMLAQATYKLEKKVVREYIIKESKRVDGRKLDEIRTLSA
jgi:polyribonucleotide nucleotidyltransferase